MTKTNTSTSQPEGPNATPQHLNPVATSSTPTGIGKTNARLLGSALSGISELLLFHPVDTIAKRLMTNETRILAPTSPALTVTNLNTVIFQDAAAAGASSKVVSLFPGLGFGATYKVLQRV